MLDNTNIANPCPTGALVANLLGAPGEAGVTLSYALVSGDGSADNADFTIDGSTLLSALPFNYPVQNSYNIRIRVTDSNGMSSEFPFTLQNVSALTVANPIPNQGVTVPNAFNFTVPSDTFADSAAAIVSYAATLADGTPLPAWLSFDPNACAFSGTPALTDVATVQILVTATDANNSQVSAPFTLHVYPPQTAGQGLGLLGTYYNGNANWDWENIGADEIDPQVAFNWSNFPITDTSSNLVMWTGQVLAPQSGVYTFYTVSCGYSRLQVNGQLLYDWTDNWDNWISGTITLQAGQLYDINLEYSNQG